jgi:enterochelin esterase-like enzyme
VTATATFHVPDPEGRLAGIRLYPGLADFRRDNGSWTLVIDRPPLSRLEYLLQFRYPDGHEELRTDPGNPRQAGGAFGPKSVLEFPEYVPPAWLRAPADPGTMDGDIWSPAGTAPGEPLPLLMVHDGPEYDALASLTRYLAAGIADGWLPRLRAALLAPGPQRDRWYSANPRCATALARLAVPATTIKIGMGTSLGALAMLHAHCRYPQTFDALFLQSGSFFTPQFDAQEQRFPYYQRVVRFVATARFTRPIPITLTCGASEENIQNNRHMTATLQAHGYPATLDEGRDMHNYTAWRDAFDPPLTRLLQQVAR